MIKFILLTLFVFHVTSKLITENRKLSNWIVTKCVVPKTVALTFDDGPRDDFENILNILKRNKVKATFFVVGRLLQNNVWLTQRASREGHNIASHSYSHPRLTGLKSDGKNH